MAYLITNVMVTVTVTAKFHNPSLSRSKECLLGGILAFYRREDVNGKPIPLTARQPVTMGYRWRVFR